MALLLQFPLVYIPVPAESGGAHCTQLIFYYSGLRRDGDWAGRWGGREMLGANYILSCCALPLRQIINLSSCAPPYRICH